MDLTWWVQVFYLSILWLTRCWGRVRRRMLPRIPRSLMQELHKREVVWGKSWQKCRGKRRKRTKSCVIANGRDFLPQAPLSSSETRSSDLLHLISQGLTQKRGESLPKWEFTMVSRRRASHTLFQLVRKVREKAPTFVWDCHGHILKL